MKTAQLLPLYRGAIALRVCVKFTALPGLERPGCGPKVSRLEVVEVLAVEGDRITWTNHKPGRGTPGLPFVHVSDRRELISLDAIEFPSTDTTEEPLPEVAGAVSV